MGLIDLLIARRRAVLRVLDLGDSCASLTTEILASSAQSASESALCWFDPTSSSVSSDSPNQRTTPRQNRMPARALDDMSNEELREIPPSQPDQPPPESPPIRPQHPVTGTGSTAAGVNPQGQPHPGGLSPAGPQGASIPDEQA